MDLKKYGMHTVLKDADSFKIGLDTIARVKETDGIVEFASDSYKLVKRLGEGSYGAVFLATALRSGEMCAIKVQVYKKPEHANQIIQEAVLNILLMETSNTQINGPYVQKFLEAGHLPEKNALLFRLELLTGTIESLIQSNSVAINDIHVPEILLQLATISEFFQTKLHMNHRDMKLNNVMYTVINGKIIVRLIDLGFSCLTWNGVHLSGTTVFPKHHVCSRNSRDLSFFLLHLTLDFAPYLSKRLYEVLESLVTFKIRGKECRLDKMCENVGLKQWENSYNFLNRSNVENAAASPAAVRSAMNAFKQKLKPVAGKKTRRRKRK
jgi:serine/threonine protein kinase